MSSERIIYPLALFTIANMSKNWRTHEIYGENICMLFSHYEFMLCVVAAVVNDEMSSLIFCDVSKNFFNSKKSSCGLWLNANAPNNNQQFFHFTKNLFTHNEERALCWEKIDGFSRFSFLFVDVFLRSKVIYMWPGCARGVSEKMKMT